MQPEYADQRVRIGAPVLRRAGNSGIAFRDGLAPNLNPMLADAPRFETTSPDLVMNARDVMPAGGRISIVTKNADKVLGADDEQDGVELAAALETLHRHIDVSVLFSDIMMPGMNGIELAKQARGFRPDVKALLASGYPLPALDAQVESFEEFAFISKPYRLSELARKLRMA